MTGRIFKIVATKSCHEYVIVETFNVSVSRDSRYGMPTMQQDPDCEYQTIPPVVRHDLSVAQTAPHCYLTEYLVHI